MKELKEEKDKSKSLLIASQLGGLASVNHAAASNEAINGMTSFMNNAFRLGKVDPKISQGNLFEHIEAAKFNIDAASKGHGGKIKAIVTAANGEPHAAADIKIQAFGKTIREVQAKSSNSAARATHMVSDSKYDGMQKLVNSDKIDKVKELARRRAETGTLKSGEYRDTARNATGELHYKNVSSGGTSYEESLTAAKNPERYARKLECRQFKNEVIGNAKNSAIAGAALGGAISIIKNSVQIKNGEINAEQALLNVASDTAKSAIYSGSVGALGSSIRIGAQKCGIGSLVKSSVPVSLAACMIDIGVNMFKFAKGEIDFDDFVCNVGQTGTATIGSIYSGAAAGMLFGPVGAVVGSIAGYIISSHVWQTGIAILNSAKLAEEEAERIVNLCEQAIHEMRSQREEFEILLEEKLEIRRQEFEECFFDLNEGMENDSPEKTIIALNNLTEKFGKKMKLMLFDEFDGYMQNEDELIL